MRSRSDLLKALDIVSRYSEAQANTIVALRMEIKRLSEQNDDLRKRLVLPDLTAMNLDMIELERINDRLQAEIALLRAQLDNVRADNQTQAAFLREGYRFKTGEIHRD